MEPGLVDMLLLFVWINKQGFKRQTLLELSPEKLVEDLLEGTRLNLLDRCQ
jgi:hypothetical protein